MNVRFFNRKEKTDRSSYFVASQWQLMGRKLRKHKLAMVAGVVLLLIYTVAIFADFFSTYDIRERDANFIGCPPQRIRFFDDKGKFHLRPFVYGYTISEDPVTWRRIYIKDVNQKFPVHFFIRSSPYKMWNLIPGSIHLLGVKEGHIYLFGTDALGRDLYSRTIYAARISLSIGLVGVALGFILGVILGGISGYFAGTADMIIQRIIDFLISVPTIPLWMALSAALPPDWPAMRVYFGITVILSLLSWPSLARVVRGKLMSLREEEFVMAARISGMNEFSIIIRHLLPSFLSYLIVHITLAIPGMILGETALSFIGLGLRAPTVSWGTLLQDAQNVRSLYYTPWLLIPGLLVVITVLSFNFLGDGLRDAADPYK